MATGKSKSNEAQTLTQRALTILRKMDPPNTHPKRRNLPPRDRCPKCTEPLEVGQEVVRAETGHGGRTVKYYHASCYEERYIEA